MSVWTESTTLGITLLISLPLTPQYRWQKKDIGDSDNWFNVITNCCILSQFGQHTPDVYFGLHV